MSQVKTRDAEQFIKALFGGDNTAGEIEFRILGPDGKFVGRKWMNVRELANGAEALHQALETAGDTHHLYVGVATRKDRSSGGKSNIYHVPALWVDIDKTDDPTALMEFTPAPSMVVHSGGGFHGYWILETPLVADAGVVEDLLDRLAYALNGDPACVDLARQMRVPGTFNVNPEKEYCGTRATFLKPDGGERYTVADFEALPARPVKLAAFEGQTGNTRERAIALGLTLEGNVATKLDELKALSAEKVLHGDFLIGKGARDAMIAKVAGLYAAMGKPEDDAVILLQVWAKKRIDPRHPLPDEQVEKTVRSVYKTHRRNNPDHKVDIPVMPDGFSLTTQGNAERLAHRYAGKILYASSDDGGGKGTWYVWVEGKKWETGGHAEDILHTYVKEMLEDLKKYLPQARDMTEQHLWKTFINRSLDRSYDLIIRKAAPLVSYTPDGRRVTEDLFNADPDIIGIPGGEIIHLPTYTYQPMKPEHYITNITKVRPQEDPEAEWHQFVRELTMQPDPQNPAEYVENPELLEHIQKVAGYALTGHTVEDLFWILVGPTRTGKSVFIEALKNAFGDYADTGGFHMFTANKWSSEDRQAKYAVRHCRLVTAVEGSSEDRINAAALKEMTGGDRIAIRGNYKGQQSITPKWKFILGTNDIPEMDASDSALWIRAQIIPCVHRPKEINKKWKFLFKMAEAPVVLDWAIKGAQKYYAAKENHRLDPPAVVKKQTDEVRSSFDSFGAWFEEHVVLEPRAFCSRKDARASYEKWVLAENRRLDGRGPKLRPPQELYRYLDSKFTAGRQRHKGRGWYGFYTVDDNGDPDRPVILGFEDEVEETAKQVNVLNE